MGAYEATSYNKNVTKFPAPKPSMLAAQQQPARALPAPPNPTQECAKEEGQGT
jgi:hypothetical protein